MSEQEQLGIEPEGGSAHRDIRDLSDGERVDSVYVVKDRSRRPKKNGEEFLVLKLADRSGSVGAKSWDEVEDRFEIAAPGTPVHIQGRFEDSARWGASLIVESIREAQPEEFDPGDLIDCAPVSLERMEAGMRELLATIQDPDLQALLDRFFGEESEIWNRFRDAPAAKYYHQAYKHGLLDHSLSVAQSVSTAASTFPGINRDVAVAGALLHDIGKTEAYNDDPLAFDLTDAGRLQGEIPLGYYKIRREIEEIPGFDPETAQAVLHIVLSHHGKLEHGSPVTPATREAALVHAMDNLGGTLGSFDRIERELPEGESWSRFDRDIDSAAYFGSRASEARSAGDRAA